MTPSETALDRALHARIDGRIRSAGSVDLPAVPALRALYLERLDALFRGIGCPLDARDRAALFDALGPPLDEAFAASQHGRVRVRWSAAGGVLRYRVHAVEWTLAEAYDDWAIGREAPFFGAHPDAAVVAAAADLPPGARALDLGAGTGRNAVPLADAGLEVHAVELTGALARGMRADRRLRVWEGDVLDPALLPADLDFDLIVASELTTHLRGPPGLRRLFELTADRLRPGGQLLLNAFVCDPDYAPSLAVRQASEVMWCTVYTRADLASATADLPLVAALDTPAAALERQGQPSWPPTRWYEAWADGRDLFALPEGDPPVTLRWLSYRRT